ncbi:MAG: hypothetical protein IPK80_19390 [Nannocystis sp.]|nr:hypothetical protein [Nannocystis sp.]
MEISNQLPMGEQDPRLRSDEAIIYHTSVEIQIYDQADKLAGLTWLAGDLSVPRWKHTFSGTGSTVYKPAEGDTRRYKAKAIAHYIERERTSESTWGPEQKGTSWATIDYLHDGGQAVAIIPRPGAPRDITLTASLEGPAPSLFAGGGTIYLVNTAGDLARYRHDATGTFANYSGQVIGWGWAGMRSLHAVREGGLYVVTSGGDLRYYHHDDAGTWDDVHGKTIGGGWGFPWVGAGRFGQLYAITAAGDLLYYQHDGGFNWTIAGQKLGVGWPSTGVFAGGTNCLYLVDASGNLLHYYHDNARNWVHTALPIGTGWGGFASLASSGNGEIYALAPSGTLLFYRHDVNHKFIAGSGREIGWGWSKHGPHGLLPAAR